MDATKVVPDDDERAGLLASFDEALAAGARPEEAAPMVSDRASETAEGFAADLAFVARLRRLWPGLPRAGEKPTDDCKVPDRLGRFHLLRELGRGGFGAVYLALDPLLIREVTLTVPHSEALLVPVLRELFLKQARVAAGLNHPNLMTVFETGEDGPFCYAVREYCPGGTLADYLRARGGPLSPRDAAEVAIVLADAVEYAHQRGVLHQDINPTNVWLGKESDRATTSVAALGPRLTDFVLTRPVAREGDGRVDATWRDEVQTWNGSAPGTPAYLAPEQVAGRALEIAPPTDVYGLGTVLYEMLTGRPPFGGASPADLADQVLIAAPALPRSLNRAVPRDLEAICLQCLEKRPERRYATAAALAADLRCFLAGEPPRARPRSVFWRATNFARRPGLAAALGAVAAALLFFTVGSIRDTANRQSSADTLDGARTGPRDPAAESDELRRLAEARESTYVSDIVRVAQMLRDERHEPAGELLNRHRPRAGEADLRGVEWHHLWHRARADLHLRGHRGAVFAVATAADGRVAASAGADGVVRLWDLETARLSRQFLTELSLSWVALSPDRRLVATSGEHQAGNSAPGRTGGVRVWEVTTGLERLRLECGGIAPAPVAFAPDSRHLAVSQTDEQITLWDLSPNAGPARFPAKTTGKSYWIGFGADGRSLDAVCLTPGPVWVRAVLHHRAVVPDLRERGPVQVGEISPTQTLLAANSGRVAIFDPVASDLVTLVRGADHDPKRVGLDPLPANSVVTAVALAADGRGAALAVHPGVRSAAQESWVRVWDLVGERPRERGTLTLHNGQSTPALAFTPNGRTLVIGCTDGQVRLWEPGGRPAFRSFAAHADEAWGLAFSPDGKVLLTTSNDHTVRAWNLTAGGVAGVPLPHDALVAGAAFAPDGRTVATAGFDGAVRLWTVADWKLLRTLQGHRGAVRGVAWSPAGATVASVGDDRTVRLWDASRGTPITEFVGHTGKLHAVAFHPDGKTLVTAGNDNTVRLWDVAAAKTIRTWTETGSVLSACFSPDGRYAAAGTERGVVKLYRTDTGEERADIWGHRDVVRAVTFSPDGRTLASAGRDQRVKLWHVGTGQELLALDGHKAQVNGLAFRPDGRTLASTDHSGAVYLWPTGAD